MGCFFFLPPWSTPTLSTTLCWQLCYDITNGGATFRKFNGINLAWWHSYKHVSLKVWDIFARDYLAPWWHRLYPGGQFHCKPSSFASVRTHMVMLSLAYPHIKPRLEKALQQASIIKRFKVALSDLEFLFEFALPTVPSLVIVFEFSTSFSLILMKTMSIA